MTQQGQRQARFRTWGKTSLTYNGDMMSAGLAASGGVGTTVNEAEWYLHGAISNTDATTLSGRQAATAEYLEVPGGWDAVGDQLPVFGLDFTSGGEFTNLLYGRQVRGTTELDNLLYAGPDAARSGPSGLLVEWQATNKCINDNLKPADTSDTTPQAVFTTWEVVARENLPEEIELGLAEIDPQGNVTSVYHGITNGGGNVKFEGATGNTNQHYASQWQYVVSGNVGPSLEGVANPTYGPGGWERQSFGAVPPLATTRMVAATSAASEFYLFGNQLEEQEKSRSSTIETQGGAQTRLGDFVYSALPVFDNSSFVIVATFNKYVEPRASAFDIVTQIADAGVTNVMFVTVRHTNLQIQCGATGIANIAGPTYVVGETTKVAFGLEGTTLRFAVDGVFAGSSTIVPPASYANAAYGCTSTGGQQLGGYLEQWAAHAVPATVANVEKLSK